MYLLVAGHALYYNVSVCIVGGWGPGISQHLDEKWGVRDNIGVITQPGSWALL